MSIKSAKGALATHFNCDIADMKGMEYQYGRYTKQVYSSGNDYYCATKNPKQLPKPTQKNDDGFVWKEVADAFVNRDGWKIFKATGEEMTDYQQMTESKKALVELAANLIPKLDVN